MITDELPPEDDEEAIADLRARLIRKVETFARNYGHIYRDCVECKKVTQHSPADEEGRASCRECGATREV